MQSVNPLSLLLNKTLNNYVLLNVGGYFGYIMLDGAWENALFGQVSNCKYKPAFSTKRYRFSAYG
jgi:hypothetical protein